MAFADGLKQLVDVQVADDGADSLGGYSPSYALALAAVPCRIVPMPASASGSRSGYDTANARENMTITHKVLFEGRVALTPANRLVYTDPATSATRFLRPLLSRFAHENSHHTVVDCEEVT